MCRYRTRSIASVGYPLFYVYVCKDVMIHLDPHPFKTRTPAHARERSEYSRISTESNHPPTITIPIRTLTTPTVPNHPPRKSRMSSQSSSPSSHTSSSCSDNARALLGGLIRREADNTGFARAELELLWLVVAGAYCWLGSIVGEDAG